MRHHTRIPLDGGQKLADDVDGARSLFRFNLRITYTARLECYRRQHLSALPALAQDAQAARSRCSLARARVFLRLLHLGPPEGRTAVRGRLRGRVSVRLGATTHPATIVAPTPAARGGGGGCGDSGGRPLLWLRGGELWREHRRQRELRLVSRRAGRRVGREGPGAIRRTDDFCVRGDGRGSGARGGGRGGVGLSQRHAEQARHGRSCHCP
mmetsp:Transcript_30366/g.60994  ORF Transcript_30366/g.60994 Transcript_30366/m.60994 type:complete len:211 (-) Transcript_30366:3576-4208(-)